MIKNISYISVAIFSIFLGSQITEGVLLVPYWQSLSASDFYVYYNSFGPAIGKYYTVLTIIAAIIPIGYSIYLYIKKSKAIKYALASAFFALAFIACFYIYFKGSNALFYQGALDELALKDELIRWTKWHWGRIVLEIISLAFLILSIGSLDKK